MGNVREKIYFLLGLFHEIIFQFPFFAQLLSDNDETQYPPNKANNYQEVKEIGIPRKIPRWCDGDVQNSFCLLII